MNLIAIALRGMAMGMAEVVPGVSGGTIAFITGIYERLIKAIKSILSPSIIRSFREGGMLAFWQAIDGRFVLTLGVGMGLGIGLGVFGVSYLLTNHQEPLWGFFFGLILASVLYVGQQVDQWHIRSILALVIGTAIAYGITILNPSMGSQNLLYIFLGGVIAISALILPGISGSFILLLMGLYTTVIPAVKAVIIMEDLSQLKIVLVFGLGCLVGLASFSRVLSWTFSHYRNSTLAILAGFMLGSLNKIWPWRNVLETRVNSSGEEVPLLEVSVLTKYYEGDPQLLLVLVCMVIGFVMVYGLDRLGKK
jgi:putative membrane protein